MAIGTERPFLYLEGISARKIELEPSVGGVCLKGLVEQISHILSGNNISKEPHD